eukprot:TRINITY_DN2176_c0_g1_i2.p1 TRINITY_DN2176_c0_g1~~TRINITY_DN2176_c0_g1_i2.p1  ORF type:complete len:112 (+),score=15.08 TRINITY_DN2176_c0_g1_i2:46-336(+)
MKKKKKKRKNRLGTPFILPFPLLSFIVSKKKKEVTRIPREFAGKHCPRSSKCSYKFTLTALCGTSVPHPLTRKKRKEKSQFHLLLQSSFVSKCFVN